MKFVLPQFRTTVRSLVLVALFLTVVCTGLFCGKPNFLGGTASAQATVTLVNAASYFNDPNKAITPDTIAAAFGAFVTQNNGTFNASTVPLPMSLGGVSVTVANIQCGLFFAGPGQINLLLPSNLSDGNANVVVTNADGTTRTGTIKIERGAPGIFSASATGSGTAAGYTTTDGVNNVPLANADGSEREVSPGSTTSPNFLVIFTTGIRNTPAASVVVKIQGVPARVDFAGPAPGFVGLDQINAVIPPELSGLGIVKVTVTANNRVSNEVTIKIGGQFPDVRLTDIAIDQQVTGLLTPDDQIQATADGKTFFFDAFRFSVPAANTPLAIDLRSTQFDTEVLLYRLEGKSLILIAGDDQSGGYGNGIQENNNSLLLTVVQNAGQYVIFASSSFFQPNGVGSYSLRVRANIAQQLSYGATTTNAAITNTDILTSAGTFLDVYWFNASSGDNVRIRMETSAPDLDPFLILQTNEGDNPLPWFNDDESGGSKNAQITQLLNRNGVHIIIATWYSTGKVGAYTLSLNRLSSPPPNGSNPITELLKVPGREIRDRRGRSSEFGESTFERAGRRRIIVQ